MSLPASDLIVGNPWCRRATFTRFVLPFAWDPHSNSEGESESRPYFRPAKKDDWLHHATLREEDTKLFLDRARRRYLTPETDELVFTRAKWFVLKDEDSSSADPQIWRRFSVNSDLGTAEIPISYNVALRPPGMILFEWPQDDKFEKEADPLRIGFLIHEAFFPDPGNAPGFADLLRFNEIFRYWRSPFEDFDLEYCKKELSSFRGGVVHGSADSEDSGQCTDCTDNYFSNRWEDILRFPVKDGKGKFWKVKPVDEAGTSPLFPGWMVNPDDRAFTMPFAVLNREKPGHLAHFSPYRHEVDSSDFDQGGLWVKLLNVDRPSSNERLSDSGPFEKVWARDRTYTRWTSSNEPTLYGFCEHSLAVLCTAADKGQGDPPLGLHAGQMYFDSTLLHLYLRVGLFRFSKDLHVITAKARDEEGSGKEIATWRKDFHELRWRFLQFQNLYRFPLFSNQQQHLEMFAYQTRAMDVKELYAEVEKEVEVSDEFLENELAEERNQLGEERNQLAGTLNVIALVGLVGGLALGWMGAHPNEQSGMRYFGALCLFGFVVVIVAALFSPFVEAGVTKLGKLNKSKRFLFASLLGGVLVAAAVFLPSAIPSLEKLFQRNPEEVGCVCLPAGTTAIEHTTQKDAVVIPPPASAPPVSENPPIAPGQPTSPPPAVR